MCASPSRDHGQPSHDASARIRPALLPLDDAGRRAAQCPEEVARKVPEHGGVTESQVLRVEEPLSARVRDIESLELLPRTPVVVPHDEVGLVAKRPARSQPSVAELVVLGGLGRAEALVEPARVEHTRAVNGHVVREERTRMDLTREVVRRRIVLRRRHGEGIANRDDPPCHDPACYGLGQLPAFLDPVGSHGAVVVGDENDLVRRLLDAEVSPSADPAARAGHEPRAHPQERLHELQDSGVAALIDDEDLRGPRRARCHGGEARAQRLDPAERGHDDGRGDGLDAHP